MKKELRQSGFSFVAKATIDEDGKFLGTVEFPYFDNALRGKGLIGSHNGIEIRSAARPELNHELNKVFLPGDWDEEDEEKATTNDLPFFLKAIEALTAVQKELAGKHPSQVMVELKEILRANVKNLRETIDEWEKSIESENDPEKLTDYKGVFLDSLIQRLPVYGSSCYHCKLKDFTDTTCHDCDYGKKHGICGLEDSDWMKIRDLMESFRAAIRKAYISD